MKPEMHPESARHCRTVQQSGCTACRRGSGAGVELPIPSSTSPSAIQDMGCKYSVLLLWLLHDKKLYTKLRAAAGP